MSFTSKGTSELLVAGLQDVMFTIDIEKGIVLKQVDAPAVRRKISAGLPKV
jgi:PAB-dependent poly(A)-specific ribonuclease subunit 2